jgi:hypothetical protein
VGSKTAGLIAAHSAVANPINGNQSISYVKIDGDFVSGHNCTGTSAITVKYRNNVEIHHCTVIDFEERGIVFINNNGSPEYYSPPTVNYGTGNSIHDCIITDCSYTDNSNADPEFGSVWLNAQTGFQFYNNICTDTGKVITGNYANGFPYRTQWMREQKIHNNIFNKLDSPNGPCWNFFAELFWPVETEIYENIFNGFATFDIVDVRLSGSYTYGVKIYNNYFNVAAQVPRDTEHGTQAIDIEERGCAQYIYIYNNHFKNTQTGIQLDIIGRNTADVVLVGGFNVMDHIYVYYNLFESTGASDVA